MTSKEEIRRLLLTLEQMVRRMDVPEYRRTSVIWLKKHLADKNSKHADFVAAMEIIEQLAAKGISRRQ